MVLDYSTLGRSGWQTMCALFQACCIQVSKLRVFPEARETASPIRLHTESSLRGTRQHRKRCAPTSPREASYAAPGAEILRHKPAPCPRSTRSSRKSRRIEPFQSRERLRKEPVVEPRAC